MASWMLSLLGILHCSGNTGSKIECLFTFPQPHLSVLISFQKPCNLPTEGQDLTCKEQNTVCDPPAQLLHHMQRAMVENKSPGHCTNRISPLPNCWGSDVFPWLPKYSQDTPSLKHKHQRVDKNGGLEFKWPGSKSRLHCWPVMEPIQATYPMGLLLRNVISYHIEMLCGFKGDNMVRKEVLNLKVLQLYQQGDPKLKTMWTVYPCVTQWIRIPQAKLFRK